jgi:predicted ArsR family transcriptional regulator
MIKKNRASPAARPRVLADSRGKTLVLLCRHPQTVNELAEQLGVSDNAVRAQLQRLLRDGLAQRTGSRQGIRKPHAEYQLTARGLELFPRAYEPLLRKLVDALAEQLKGNVYQGVILEAAGRVLNEHLGALREGSPRRRLSEIMRKLNGFGLGIEALEMSGKMVVRSCSCPVASVTAVHPELCEWFARTLGKFLGAEVRQKCERGETSRCCFEMAE